MFRSAKSVADVRAGLTNRITNLPDHSVSLVGVETVTVVRSFIPTSAYVWASVGTLFFFLVAPLFLWLLVARRRQERLEIRLSREESATVVRLVGLGTDALVAAVRQVL